MPFISDAATLAAFGVIALLLLLTVLANVFTPLQAVAIFAGLALATVKTEKGA